ncbi:MAG: glycoside hydrolase family 6 protein [Nocardioides sp.]|nr:glycoside hydrolase family 6 protein [Nocardioidaceae bacterium]MCB8956410.1 glycoside hydrolase family 6 protein [Nocardioides sp.]
MPFLRRSRPRALLLTVTAVVAVVAPLAGCGGGSGGSDGGRPAADAQTVNAYAERAGYADPDSRAARAAAEAKAQGNTDEQAVFDRLAQTPTGIWLTPEEYPPGEVGPFVTKIVDGADGAGQVPTFVVYGIPDRDCTGGFSGGGLPAAQYGDWVQEIADAASGGDGAVAVVEPDALASAIECDRRGQRVALIADAVDRLAQAGVTTYVDGGHSNWVDPSKLAPLLKEVGVEDVRGFATNVSNYQSDDDERKYGEKLSGLLGGAHYIIDSGRNGNGSTDVWCNPPGRAYGTDPTAAPAGDSPHLDAYAWVKPPGESDGECNGGPPAGQFWPARAMAMAASSGW